MIGAGIKPGAGKISSELEAAGASGGTKAGTAAGKNLTSTITSSASGLAGSMTKIFAGVGAVRILGDSIGEAREAIKVGQLTDAVIKSTGASAGVTAGHVGDLANKLSSLAGVDDELIQAGENVLLTFTNVKNEVGAGNDIFDQATGIALDMSRALGTDLQGSIIQVGKALQDPIQGVGALRRVGVQLSDDQEKLVKSLVATGDVMGAQKVILAELTKEFGGAAAAAADPLDKASVAAKNAEESIGVALMPVLVNLSKVAADLAPTLAGIVNVFAALPGPVQSTVVGLLGFSFIGGKIGKLATGITGLGKAIGGLGTGVGKGVVGLGKLVAATGRLIGSMATAAARVAVSAAQMVASFVTMAARGIASFVATAARAVVSAATTAAAWIASAASAVASFVVMAAGAVVNAAIVVAAWLAAAAPFIALGLVVAAVVLLIINNWDTISTATVATWDAIVSFVTGAVSTMVDAVSGAIETVVGFYVALPGRILGALGDLGGLLRDAGAALIRGLIGGIESMVSTLLSKARDIAGSVVDTIKGVLHIGSPSRVMVDVGQDTMRGFVIGLDSELATVDDLFRSRLPNIVDINARVTGRSSFANVAAFTPAAGAGLAGEPATIVQHFHLHDFTIRSDDDITKLARAIKRDESRGLRAAGRQASLLP